ncbi:hypothetical protein ACOCEA_05855 [Maribacter sp. CXY002]|uniref:hypothetical protein n=1 Tax=Maribacter luteocoastalis TaxID=3407671 RepID=UPI003B677D97
MKSILILVNFNDGKDEVDTNNIGQRNNDYGITALGHGLGTKWDTRSDRLILEVNSVLPRNIHPEAIQNSCIHRAGLSAGFKF